MHRAIRISSVLLAITVILTCASFFVEASESPPVSDLLLSDDWLLPNSSKKLSLLNEMTGEAVNEDRWSISLTASGHYRITPMLVSSFAVSVPLISLNGSDLVQKAYTNDSNYKDEWNFFKVGIAYG